MTLFYLPFGKFFHIVQRPASIGVELYQRSEREAAQAVCPRCKRIMRGLSYAALSGHKESQNERS